eukprot:3817285-Prymnesium_polylepis.1
MLCPNTHAHAPAGPSHSSEHTQDIKAVTCATRACGAIPQRRARTRSSRDVWGHPTEPTSIE